MLGMERVERIKRNMTDLFLSEDAADAAAAPSRRRHARQALNALRRARCPVPDMGDASATFAPCDDVKPIPLPRPTPIEPFAPPPFGAPPLAPAAYRRRRRFTSRMGHRHVVLQSESGECCLSSPRCFGETNSRLQ